MRLKTGEFLGAPLRSRAAGGFTFTQYAYRAGTTLPTHEHERAYVSLPLSGGYEERTGGVVVDCGAGLPIFHPAGERHADRFGDDGATIFSIELDDSWVDRLRDCGVSANRRLDLHGTDAGRRARMLLRLIQHPAVSPLRVDAAAIELLAAIPAPTSTSRAMPRWMPRVIEALRETRPPLRELAAIAGVHAVHLARTFRAVHGCSVGEYARRRRVERAIVMLGATRDPIAAVATACGFADQSHLTRELRRITGMTPRQWRSNDVPNVQDGDDAPR